MKRAGRLIADLLWYPSFLLTIEPFSDFIAIPKLPKRYPLL